MNTNEQIQLPVKAIGRCEMPTVVSEMRCRLLEEHSALEAYVKAYNLRVVLDELLKSLKDDALAKLTSREMDVYGAKVEQRRLPKSFDYGNDGHLKALVELKEQAQKAVTDWMKIRQLQTTDLVDGKTGEIIKPPQQITDGVTIAVTLPS